MRPIGEDLLKREDGEVDDDCDMAEAEDLLRKEDGAVPPPAGNV